MNPDTPRGAGGRIGKQTTRRRYRVTFLSGLEGLKAEFTVLAVSEGNAAIACAGMLAKPNEWNCTTIERV